MIATGKSPAHRANGPFIASTCCVGPRLRRGPKRRQPTSRIPASLAGSAGCCGSSMLMGRGGTLGQLEDPNYAELQIRTSGNAPSRTYGEQGIGRASEGPAILPAVVSHTVRAAIGSPAGGETLPLRAAAPRPAPRGRTRTTTCGRQHTVVVSLYVAGHINQNGAYMIITNKPCGSSSTDGSR